MTALGVRSRLASVPQGALQLDGGLRAGAKVSARGASDIAVSGHQSCVGTANQPEGARWSFLISLLVTYLCFGTLLWLPTDSAFANGGDFSIDFAAAAPLTYTHSTGGGAFNDGTIGKEHDVVESLEGGDFTCSDTVTYFTKISVDDGSTDGPQTIQIVLDFLANSTGQPGAAHASVTKVAVNYGLVENGDDGTPPGGGVGVFGLDSGIDDDGGSTATLISQVFDPSGSVLFGTPPNDADNLILTFEVDDLELGETVVVRIDTNLACDPGSDPTGNLQASAISAEVVAPNVTNPTISVGNQTIPFRQIGDIAGAGDPLLFVEKTVTTGTASVAPTTWMS